MAEPAKKIATYEDLYSIPENMTGEIIEGELIVTPRPSKKHAYASSVLDKTIGTPYQIGGRGGPGGWIFLMDQEIKLDENIVVPALAAWRRERFPVLEETNWISVAPNWVCEILSPSTFRHDKVKKMPLYARHAVEHIWLIDPVAMTMDAFRLESGRWVLLGSYADQGKVRVEPFQEIELDLADLWIGNLLPSAV
ncbi:MAG: Uma2 family endonuclease [Deltaproteobacteria bacterium]|nr:Uma2 family endonuclease [Deltaproteobacteria bacterium]